MGIPLKYIKDITIVIIIFIFTFPRFEPSFGMGLDPSYIWALNNLFHNHYDTLINLTYPIGPLGFIKLPTTEAYNLIISIIAYSIVKISFLILLLKLDILINNKRSIASVLLILIASYYANIDFLIIGNVLILSLLNFAKLDIKLFALSVFFAIFGFFIKSSIGITSFSMIFISIVANYNNRTFLLKQIGVSFIIVLTVGLIILKGDILLFINHIIGIIKLSSGYSDTLSLHPNNNWWLLGIFLLLILSLPLFIKDRRFRFSYLLLLFPLFATWKHAMTREDISHYNILINYLFVFGSIIVITTFNKKKLVFAAFFISILLVFGNMTNIPQYSSKEFSRIGLLNFTEILDFNNFKNKYSKISSENVAPNILNKEIRNIIGNASIDIYPWDHSYIAANNLNWQARKTIEIGVSTSRWASKKASENYKIRETAPEYILFHLQKDKYNGTFASIDGRYILNDEPLVIFNLLQNYSIITKTEKYILFKKNTDDNIMEVSSGNMHQSKFGEWMDIPSNSHEITRLKIISHNTFLGKIKEFLYKEESYFIDYKLKDGRILTYRYVPSTAVDGLWCNPFILNPENTTLGQKVIKVRLRNSNSLFISNSIEIKTEHLKLNKKPDYLFLKTKVNRDSVIINKTMDFEQTSELLDQEIELDNDYYFSNQKSNLVKSNGFSYIYKYSLDSLWKNINDSIEYLQIDASIYYMNDNSEANIVISISESQENIWHGEKLNSSSDWNYSYINNKLSRQKHSTGNISVYVWNTGDENIYIDDFWFSIKTVK